ncbi:unnamed protein product [Taenia asiatica]|uniref:Uncharacterized protein n=1 Tax=Taenia asiatica TaxID=60517 RepID=A0A0R3VXM9_TAEAS|nr:unnamed protein product [Taenia asiatica]
MPQFICARQALLRSLTWRYLFNIHERFLHPDELFFSSLAYNPNLKMLGACLIAPAPISEVDLNYLAKFFI